MGLEDGGGDTGDGAAAWGAQLRRLGRARQPQDDGEDESELRVGEDDQDRRTSEKEQGSMQRRAEARLGPRGRVGRPSVAGKVAGELGVGTVCTEKLDDGDLPATSWERNRVGLDKEKVQRWDKGRARAEKRGGVYDERQR
jgi:hypothetical protein